MGDVGGGCCCWLVGNLYSTRPHCALCVIACTYSLANVRVIDLGPAANGGTSYSVIMTVHHCNTDRCPLLWGRVSKGGTE